MMENEKLTNWKILYRGNEIITLYRISSLLTQALINWYTEDDDRYFTRVIKLK